MRIAAITFGDRETASTKFRLVDYLPFLQEKGIEVALIPKQNVSLESLRGADAIINQKSLLSPTIGKKIVSLGKPILFDIDDAIYARSGRPYGFFTRWRLMRRLRFWTSNSSLVLTANGVLADEARRYSNAVVVLPMGLDLNQWRPAEKSASALFTVGWAGAPHNLPLLEAINPALQEIHQQFPQVQFAVYSGAKPKLTIPFLHVPFQPGSEPAFTQTLDIGLLPLVDDAMCRSKSPIKAIQYLACGVPVVGNRVGATCEILNDRNSLGVCNLNDWVSALKHLIMNPDSARKMGGNGRAFAKSYHDRSFLAEQLYQHLVNL